MYSQFSPYLATGVIDKYGNEIWNTQSIYMNHVNDYGKLYGLNGPGISFNFDEEINEYVLYPLYNQTVTVNQDYISIPIVSLIQSYLFGDLNIFDNDFQIRLSSPSDKFNFSRISINDIESRVEVFYSE